MAVSHQETFAYSDWNIRRSGVVVTSSGTGSKLSDLFPINKLLGTIQGTAKGGYGWCAAYGDDENIHGDSLYCTLKLSVYLVAADGVTKVEVASAQGSAQRGGELQCYDRATTGTLTFDTTAITDAQKASYQYLQFGYTCTTSKSRASVSKVGSFENGGTGNPTGSVSVTLRDTINVNYDGTELTNLYFDTNEMGGLVYDGTVIF